MSRRSAEGAASGICALAKRMATAAGVLCAAAVPSGAGQDAGWPYSGRDIHNTRNAADERVLNPSRVSGLEPLWIVETDGAVAATPAVVDGVVYAPDFGGSLWAVEAATGRIIWKNAVAGYTGVPGGVSRTTPAYWRGALIMGEGVQAAKTLEGATMFALDARSGRPLWRTKVEDDPLAIVTSSPIVDDGVVYVGAASKGETLERPITFRGSVVALSAETGRILWKTYLTGEGYAGAGVWGSTPVVSHDTGLVYVATGNNYSVPPGVCRVAGGMMWGSATDGRRIYVSISNGDHAPVTIASDDGRRRTTTGGFWAALDAATGGVLWRTADPQGALDVAALSVGDGVVYAGSLAPQGNNMYALDAATGAVKWAFASGGAVVAGAAIVDGAVYWGSRANRLYAFATPRK